MSATLPTVADTRPTTNLVGAPVCLSDSDAISDPPFDIGPSVADVLADPKADGTLSSVPPRIQRLDRNVEENGEVLGRKQAVVVVHIRDRELGPFRRDVISLPSRRERGTLDQVAAGS